MKVEVPFLQKHDVGDDGKERVESEDPNESCSRLGDSGDGWGRPTLEEVQHEKSC